MARCGAGGPAAGGPGRPLSAGGVALDEFGDVVWPFLSQVVLAAGDGKVRATGWQAAGLARLAETIPHAETMTFPKLGHFAPEKNPGKIARRRPPVLRRTRPAGRRGLVSGPLRP